MFGYLFLLIHIIIIDAAHFNGGTIRWIPVNPYDNSASITITIVQSYWWTYPTVNCTTNVPISTPMYSGTTVYLICIGNCSNNGGYSISPINVLTDCSSASLPLHMMTSERSTNIALTSGAQFYLAYQMSGWRPLNNPPISPGAWSIVSFINLQMRPDGFINTPPVARIVSPQFAIINTMTRIQIITSDVNTGDDIRCRWSQQANISNVDECGTVCYPSNIPNSTTISNCTIFFQGSTVGIWYAGAVQVEDFINTASTTPMSSVPVQFLISVISVPICTQAPIIIPLTGCLEVPVGVLETIDIYALNLCNPNITGFADIFLTSGIDGMQLDSLTNSSTNASLFYKTLTWTPQAGQLGPQQMCIVAYTNNFLQSTEYCVTFTVITSQPCLTTATTATTATIATISTSSSIITIDTGTTTNAPGKSPSWGLIAGISSLALPLALCSCYCLYRLVWRPTAKHRHPEEREEDAERQDRPKYNHLNSSVESALGTSTPRMNDSSQIEVPRKSYQVYNIAANGGGASKDYSSIDSRGSILISIYNRTNAKRGTSSVAYNNEQSIEMGNAWTQPSTGGTIDSNMPTTRRVTLAGTPANGIQQFKPTNQSSDVSNQLMNQENMRTFTNPAFDAGHFSISQSWLETTYELEQSQRLTKSLPNFQD